MVEHLKGILSLLFQDDKVSSADAPSEQKEFTDEEWAEICDQASKIATLPGMTMERAINGVVTGRRGSEYIKTLLLSRKKLKQ